MSNVLKNLPSASELLESPPLKSLIRRVNRNVVVSGVRRFLDDLRGQVQGAAAGFSLPAPSELAERIAAWIAKGEEPTPRPAINGTGVLLPAIFSGPPLADDAILAVHHLAQGFAPTTDQAAAGVERRLARMAGADAALVTTSHAAALTLSLAALAAGREVIVARSELAEWDDGTRTADLVAAAGAVLREVGSANKTRLADYSTAMTSAGGALLRVQASQCAVVGSVEETPLAELAALARKHQHPLIHDLGIGGLLDLGPYGVEGAPRAGESLEAGSDLVVFAGEKLLGGPRCGLVVGSERHVAKLRAHPLLAAMRAGPMTLAALGETLRLVEDPQLAERSIPLLSLLATPIENLRNRAERLAPQLAAVGIAGVRAMESDARLLDAVLPGQKLSSYACEMTPVRGTAAQLAATLQSLTPSVHGRIEGERLLLDLRGVLPSQDLQLAAAFESLATATAPTPSEPPVAPDSAPSPPVP
jgi:L-seryl-tRNA(Ser) seleniumtransferase